MATLLRILVVLACGPLAVLPGLNACRYGLEPCEKCQAHHDNGDDADDDCDESNPDRTPAPTPSAKVVPPDAVPAFTPLALVPSPVRTARHPAAPASAWPHGPPLYVAHRALLI